MIKKVLPIKAGSVCGNTAQLFIIKCMTKENFTNFIGKKYGNLTILSEDKEISLIKKRRYVKSICDCGNIKSRCFSKIKNGYITKCANCKLKTHGEYKSLLYFRWQNIKNRCFNKNYHQWELYGGRGITMCNEWKNDYTKFRDWALVNGYKPELQIDRTNNNGNYEPNNCRWVTAKKNSNNRRSNILVKYKGKTLPLKIWCEKLGLKYKAIWRRIQKHNWTVKKAFETKLKTNKGNQYKQFK